jgi:hypothetical protein
MTTQAYDLKALALDRLLSPKERGFCLVGSNGEVYIDNGWNVDAKELAERVAYNLGGCVLYNEQEDCYAVI